MERFGTIDLCSGMGGLSYAAQKAGLDIWAGVDISTSALSSFKYNFPTASTILGDVSEKNIDKKIFSELNNDEKIKKNLIIVSGPPCQGFSDAGSRMACDPRNEILISGANTVGHSNNKI